MEMYNRSWIGQELTVKRSTDTTLVNRSGIVVAETRNTLSLIEEEQTIVLTKTHITFTICNSDVAIEGDMVNQRPKDRIHRHYRMA